MGDEPREKVIFDIRTYIIQDLKVILYFNFLKKTSISIVCSRWDEPFGRTSLEASSRGAAVIISNRGGLPETVSAIILKSLDKKNLYKEISDLIKNKKRLVKKKANYEIFFLIILEILDNLRNKYLIKKINLNIKKILKIMHITNFNYRFDGRLHYNTGRRINNGFVRLGHNVLTVSDKYIA